MDPQVEMVRASPEIYAAYWGYAEIWGKFTHLVGNYLSELKKSREGSPQNSEKNVREGFGL